MTVVVQALINTVDDVFEMKADIKEFGKILDQLGLSYPYDYTVHYNSSRVPQERILDIAKPLTEQQLMLLYMMLSDPVIRVIR